MTDIGKPTALVAEDNAALVRARTIIDVELDAIRDGVLGSEGQYGAD
jgi:hypothetical protein